MTIEKNKIYKIFHNIEYFGEPFPRDYLLVCPNNTYEIDDDFLGKKFPLHTLLRNIKKIQIECLFIKCFDEAIIFEDTTTLYEDCWTSPLIDKDIYEIKEIMEKMGGNYKYNRKLNQIVTNEDCF
jgi:hypothetical protein